jgi:hypothetical protein
VYDKEVKEMKENITLTKGELNLISWLAIGFVYETVKELMEILDFEEEEEEKE